MYKPKHTIDAIPEVHRMTMRSFHVFLAFAIPMLIQAVSWF